MQHPYGKLQGEEDPKVNSSCDKNTGYSHDRRGLIILSYVSCDERLVVAWWYVGEAQNVGIDVPVRWVGGIQNVSKLDIV